AGVRPSAVVKLLLHSSNTIIKETPVMPGRLERPAPDPRRGAGSALCGRDAGRLYLLGRISHALSGDRRATAASPPAVRHGAPARLGGDADVLERRMVSQPGRGLDAGMTAEMIGAHREVPGQVVGLEVGEASAEAGAEAGAGARRVPRGGTAGQLVASAHA